MLINLHGFVGQTDRQTSSCRSMRQLVDALSRSHRRGPQRGSPSSSAGASHDTERPPLPSVCAAPSRVVAQACNEAAERPPCQGHRSVRPQPIELDTTRLASHWRQWVNGLIKALSGLPDAERPTGGFEGARDSGHKHVALGRLKPGCQEHCACRRNGLSGSH